MAADNLLTAAGGSLSTAVEAVLALGHALWAAHENEPAVSGAYAPSPEVVHLDRELLAAHLTGEILQSPLARVPGVDPERFREVFFSEIYPGPDSNAIRLRYFSPLATLTLLVQAPEADLKYRLMHAIRRRSRVVLSPSTIRAAYRLADLLRRTTDDGTCPVPLPVLKAALQSVPAELKLGAAADYVQMAIDVWSAVWALRPIAGKGGAVSADRDLLDGSQLIAHAFGLPTSIPGFDSLFHGGLILPDVSAAEPKAGAEQVTEHVGVRTVVVIAPFGSGKSLLSLQMAVEVARKGGIALVMALEQTPEECLWSLESIGVPVVNEESFTVVSGYREAFPVLSRPMPGRGALVFLPAIEPPPVEGQPAGSGDSFTDLMSSLREKFSWLENYPLRLLIIDPLSALYPRGTAKERAEAVRLLHEAKARGVNIWITSEEQVSGDILRHFEQNIADTIIRLGMDRETAERSIEITKSRLQPESVGRHVLHITGHGLRMHPTPAGYLRRTAPRGLPVQNEIHSLGVPGLKEVLGRDAVCRGDMITLHGATGTSKTVLGLQFLRAVNKPANPNLRSLFIADTTESQMQHLLQAPSSLEAREQVLCMPVAPGLVDPGDLLTAIERILEQQRLLGKPVDRVLVTNLSRWLLDMPRVGQDRNFPLALVALLRRYDATAMLVCGHTGEATGAELVNFLFETSECAIEVVRADVRGHDRYFLRVLKSRRMKHRPGRYELRVDESGVSVSQKESLIRVDSAGNVEPVEVVLFLHSETPKHDLYNERMVGALCATLSPRTTLAPQTRTYDPQMLRLGSASSVDQMQILQLDQFQLPRAADWKNSGLYTFSHDMAGPLLEDRLPRFRESCLFWRDHERQALAVPFYANLSLLACREQAGSLPTDWSAMAEEAARFQGEGLYFAAHTVRSNNFESYNCLFLEILYSWQKPPADEGCGLANWLSADRDKTLKALRCFHLLLQRYHYAMLAEMPNAGTDAEWQSLQNRLAGKALVSRHWYNTLNQMLADLAPDQRAPYHIAWLPCGRDGERYMTTAGEWYLAVPQYSAAPEVALDVIEFMTMPDKEMQRVHIGVGLPTRSDYYNRESGVSDVSPFFDLRMPELRDLMEKAFRRSQFACYQAFADTLSSHLQRLLETAAPNFASTLDGLLASLNFIRSRQLCESCRAGQSLATPSKL